MWILKAHIAISVLCWLSTVTMKIIFKGQYERYGAIKRGGILKRIAIYICPIFNIVAAFTFAVMAFLPDETAEKLRKEAENDNNRISKTNNE